MSQILDYDTGEYGHPMLGFWVYRADGALYGPFPTREEAVRYDRKLDAVTAPAPAPVQILTEADSPLEAF